MFLNHWRALNKKSKWSWGFLLLAAAVHLTCIGFFSVDIPYWDEWEAFSPNGLSKNFDWNWIFAFHTENRQVTAKLLSWISLVSDDWNLRHQIFVINLFYIAGVILLILSFARLLKSRPLEWWFPLVFSLFFSPKMYENTLWGFQANYLLTFFFLSGVLYTLTHFSVFNKKTPIILTFWSICAAYSLGFGVIITAAVSFGLLVGLIQQRIWRARAIATFWALHFILYFAAIRFWFIGRPPSASLQSHFDIPALLHHHMAIWTLTLGHHPQISAWLGILPFVFFIFIAIISLKKISAEKLPILFFFLGIALTLLFVSMARHQMGFQQAYSSRYFLFAFLMLPFLSFYVLAIDINSVKAQRVSRFVSVALFLGFLGNWSFSSYSSTQTERIDQRACLREHFNDSKIDCGSSYPADLRTRVDRAKDLGVSFIRDLHQ